jgi:CPA1 family monovalent cation:H+ antiporter
MKKIRNPGAYFNQKSFVRIMALIGFTLILVSCSSAPILQNPNHPASTPSESGQRAGNFVQTEEIVIGLLVVAALVSIVTQRLRIPYSIGLVLVGLGLTFVGQIPVLSITPEIILALLVPPLVFEAAFHLNFTDLRRDLPVILALAILGVILTTLLVGGLVSITAGIGLSTAMIFGALIAATDPVAVIALFRTIGAPKRLQVLLEGESLLNDGTAIVLFNLMLGIAITGRFNFGISVVQFFIVAGGGIVVGLIAGILVSQLIGRIDNHLIETMLTTILAYGSYLIAEYFFGVSGVLAVVAAGLYSGHFGPKGMSPTTRIVVFNFWEYAAFLANSFIFLIIGLQINLDLLIKNAQAIGWAILAVLIARAVTVYGLSWIGKGIDFRWKNIIFWGGLRGAISLALALSLPIDIPNRAQLQSMAFGVVLFSLVVEGLTMKPLIHWSGLIRKNAAQRDYEKHHAKAIALRFAQTRIKQLNREGLISDYTWRIVKPFLDDQSKALADTIHTVLETDPGLHQEELSDTWREALRSQRSTLASLFRDNIISEETYEDLVSEVDIQLANPQSTWPELVKDEKEETPIPNEADNDR